jgi:cysteine sulfinate desulfinase/cysteine desulfurase-like protein
MVCGFQMPVVVLRALHGAAADRRATVRFSLGRSATEEDIALAGDALTHVVARMRAKSGNGKATLGAAR